MASDWAHHEEFLGLERYKPKNLFGYGGIDP